MGSPRRNWCFTINESREVDELFPEAFDTYVNEDSQFKKDVKACVWQWEIAPETNRRHIQGYVELNKPMRISGLKALFRCPTMHCEARRGTRQQAREYCRKAESRAGPEAGPFECGDFGIEERARTDLNEARLAIQRHASWSAVVNDPEIANEVARYRGWAREVYENRPVEVPAPEIILRTWQQELIGMLDEPVQKRRIIWIWSTESGTGKTTMFDYCSALYNILPGGDYQNTLYAYDGQGVIWFDLSRHQTHEHIPYHALEKFSNQTLHLSTKYVTCKKYVSAHIVVTANIAPDETRLPDRCAKIYAVDH